LATLEPTLQVTSVFLKLVADDSATVVEVFLGALPVQSR